MNYLTLAASADTAGIQEAAGNLLDDLVKHDRIFVIMALALLFLFGVIAWISFKRHLRMLDNMEIRMSDKQKENLELVGLVKDFESNLTQAQEINQKMAEIANQQQQYIETQKADRRLMESMNSKLDTLHLEVVKK
ncbi:hypothetical protein E3W82_00330 [Listeria monocytogenes]|uniref:hypothetical protein n=1 Tax=Listeria monocytogenes TaxID=1639 RepID=UPI0008746AA1|nr:hypothetical protein [Listeria monocytogenes]EAC5221521.1 hypothetical protein [Listeria monocytogenes]EAE3677776.1 hypothetical protein [Listeria monocytogenes]EAE5902759.1 hypothetical protein [Listeria monocytogenes]EAG2102923.1 hypothetical protein [Listeria monocytogenes]EHK9329998.1 hypothetical protein [Listeria monocytogenes]